MPYNYRFFLILSVTSPWWDSILKQAQQPQLVPDRWQHEFDKMSEVLELWVGSPSIWFRAYMGTQYADPAQRVWSRFACTNTWHVLAGLILVGFVTAVTHQRDSTNTAYITWNPASIYTNPASTFFKCDAAEFRSVGNTQDNFKIPICKMQGCVSPYLLDLFCALP